MRWWFVLLAGCSGGTVAVVGDPGATPADTDFGDADTDADGDTDADSDADVDSDTDTDADTDTDTDPDTGPDPDADRDGDGDPDVTDCAPGDPLVGSHALDVCPNGVDEDCSGAADDGAGVYWASDFDDEVAGVGLTLNGTASQRWTGAGGFVRLTAAGDMFSAGTAMVDDLVPNEAWEACFTFQIGGGGGADGVAFVFLDETDPTYLGAYGGELGAKGGTGNAVAMWTWSGYERVALVETATWKELATEYAVPPLRNVGPVGAVVRYDAGVVELYLDGTRYLRHELSSSAPLPDEVLMGVTSGTGGYDDNHDLLDLTIATAP